MDHKTFIDKFNEGAYGSARYGAATLMTGHALLQYMDAIQAENNGQISAALALAIAVKNCLEGDHTGMNMGRVGDAIHKCISERKVNQDEYKTHLKKLWANDDNSSSPTPA